MNRNTKFIIVSNGILVVLLWLLFPRDKNHSRSENIISIEEKPVNSNFSEISRSRQLSPAISASRITMKFSAILSMYKKIDFKVTGSVFDNNGLPVSNSLCKLFLVQLKMHLKTETNGDGKFKFSGNIQQLYMIQGKLTITHPFFKEYKNDKIYLYDGNGYEHDVGKIVLKESFEILVSGRVLTEEKIPISGNTVQLSNSNFQLSDTTDSSGKFEIRKKMHYQEIVKFNLKIEKNFFHTYESEIILNQNNHFSSKGKDYILKRIITQGNIEGHVKTDTPKDLEDLKAIIEEKTSYGYYHKQESDIDSNGYFKVSFKAKLGLKYMGNVRVIAPEKELASKDFTIFMDKKEKVHSVYIKINRPKRLLKLEGTIKHGLTDKPLEKVKVSLNAKSKHFSVIANAFSDSTGYFVISKSVYVEEFAGTVTFEKKNFVTGSQSVEFGSSNNWKAYIDVVIRGKLASGEFSGIIYDEKTQQPLPFASVNVMIEKPVQKAFESVKSDNDGKFSWKYDQFEHGSDYEIKSKFSKEYYFEKSQNYHLKESEKYFRSTSIYMTENRKMKNIIVTGTVQQESTGDYISNEQIHMNIVSNNKKFQYQRKYEFSSKSDETGRFQIEGVVKEGFQYEGDITFTKENFYSKKQRAFFEVDKYEKNIGTVYVKGKPVNFLIQMEIKGDYLKAPLENVKIDVSANSKQNDKYHKTLYSNEQGKAEYSDVVEYGKVIHFTSEFSRKHFSEIKKEGVLNKDNSYQSKLTVEMNRKQSDISLKGVIKHKANDSPISKAQTTLVFSSYLTETYSSTTDESGKFSYAIKGYHGLEYNARLKTSKENYKDTEVSSIIFNEKNYFTQDIGILYMKGVIKDASITGEVVDSSLGTKIPNAAITYSNTYPKSEDPIQGYTNENGRILLGFKVEFGSDFEGDLLTTKNHFIEDKRKVKLLQSEEYSKDVGKIVMKRKMVNVVFKGTILQKSNNKAISDAKVVVKTIKPLEYSKSTNTNENGEFQIEANIEEGINFKSSISIEKENFNPLQSNFEFTSAQYFTKDFGKLYITGVTKKSEIVLTVQDARNSNPLSEAKANVKYSTQESGVISEKDYYSNENGAIVISQDVEYNNDYSVSTLVSKANYLEQSKTFKLNVANNYRDKGLVSLERISRKESIDGSVVLDLTKRKLPETKIELKLSKLNIEKSTFSDTEGNFAFSFNGFQGEDYDYSLFITKENYKEKKVFNSIGSKSNYTSHNNEIMLTGKAIESELKGKLINNLNSNSVRNLKVQAFINSPIEYSQETYSNDNGEFFFQKSLEFGEDYTGKIVVDNKGFKKVEKSVRLRKSTFYKENIGEINMISENIKAIITGKLVDKQFGKEVTDTPVYFQEKSNGKIFSSVSDNTGSFAIRFIAEEDKNYYGDFFVNQTDFEYFTKTIELKESNRFSYDLEKVTLTRKSVEINLFGKVVDEETDKLLDSVNVLIDVEEPERRKYQLVTQGSFDLKFQGLKGIDYKGNVEISKKFYYPKSKRFSVGKKNNYQQDLGKISMQRGSMKALVTALVLDEFNSRRESEVKAVMKLSHDIIVENKTNSRGKVNLMFFGRQGKEYDGYLKLSKIDFLDKEVQINLNTNNNYIRDLGEVRINRIPRTAHTKAKLIDNYFETPLEGAKVEIKVDTPKFIMKNDYSNTEGLAKIDFDALQGLNYVGNIYFSKDFFKSQSNVIEYTKENNYTKDMGNIKMERQDITGKVYGKLKRKSTGKPLPSFKYSLNFESPKIMKKQFTTDDYGNIMEKIDLKRGVNYKGTLDTTQENYVPVSKPFTLNEDNKFTMDVGELEVKGKAMDGTIKGQVTNQQTKSPISKASIYIKKTFPSIKEYEALETDESGYYEFHNRCEFGRQCEYNVDTRKYGYETASSKAILSKESNYTKTLNIGLKRAKVLIQINGKCVHGRDINPLQDAKVSATLSGFPFKNYTNANGEFILQGEVDQERKFTFPVKVTKENYQEKDVQLTLKEEDSYKANMGNIVVKGKPVDGIVKGTITNSYKKAPEPDVKVQIIPKEKNDLNEYKDLFSDVQGKFQGQYSYEYGESYRMGLKYTKLHFLDGAKDFQLSKDNSYSENMELTIERKEVDLIVKGHITRFNDKANLKGANIKLVAADSIGSPVIKNQESDENGNYEFLLKGKEGIKYQCNLEVSKENYISLNESFSLSLENKYYKKSEFEIHGKKTLMIISGFILDDVKSKGIANSKLQVNLKTPFKKDIGSFYSKSDGSFNIEDSQEYGPEYIYELKVSKRLFNNQTETVKLTSEEGYRKEKLEIKLSKTVTSAIIEGFVVQKFNGKKIPEMQVDVTIKELGILLSGKTDKEGYFYLKKEIKEDERFTCEGVFTKENFKKKTVEFEILSTNNFKKNLGTVYVNGETKPAKFSGVVLDSYSKIPVQEALVRIEILKPVEIHLPNSYTDKDGQFQASTNVEYNVDYSGKEVIVKKNYEENTKNFEINVQNNYIFEQKVNLQRKSGKARVYGQVVNSITKNPISQASVKLSLNDERNFETNSDEQGKFNFNIDIKEGLTYYGNMTYAKEHYEKQTQKIELSEKNIYEQNLGEISLQAEKVDLKISGQVMDKGWPIHEAKVTPTFLSPYKREESPAFTDKEGKFYFQFQGSYDVEYLIQLNFHKKLFKDSKKELTLNVNNLYTKNIKVDLIRTQREFTVSGNVVQRDRQIGDAKIKLEFKSLDRRFSTATDTEGKFQLKGILENQESYEGQVAISKENYQLNVLDIRLNQENSFTKNLKDIQIVGNQVPSKIKGIILDQDSKIAINEAKVKFEISSLKLANTSYSDKNGNFIVSNKVEYGLDYSGNLLVQKENYYDLSKAETLTKEKNYLVEEEMYLSHKISDAMVNGKTINHITSEPLNDINVNLKLTSPEQKSYFAKSDSQGNFFLTFKIKKGIVYKGTTSFESEKSVPKTLPLKLSTENSYAHDYKEVSLQGKPTTCIIRGYVKSQASGSYIEGIAVKATLSSPKLESSETISIEKEGKSSSNGFFELKLQCEMLIDYKYNVKFTSDEFLIETKEADLNKNNGYISDLGIVELVKKPKGIVEGRVTDLVYKVPVSKAQVDISYKKEGGDKSDKVTVFTGKDGDFKAIVYIDSPKLSYDTNIVISKEKYKIFKTSGNLNPSNNHYLKIEGEMTPTRVTLKLVGKVIDQQGDNVDDGELQLKFFSSSQESHLSTKTSNFGTFSFSQELDFENSFSAFLSFKKEMFDPKNDTYTLNIGNRFSKEVTLHVVRKIRKIIGYQRINGRVIEQKCRLNRFLPSQNFYIQYSIMNFGDDKAYKFGKPKHYENTQGFFSYPAPVFEIGNKPIKYYGKLKVYADHSTPYIETVNVGGPNYQKPKSAGVIRLYSKLC